MVTSAWVAGSPPAEGWMEVYSLVCVEGYSIPDAAAKLNLPAAKVRQTRNQVIIWLATNRPLLTERSKEEALRLSEALARERLEHLYAEAMDAWKNSQQEEIQTRQEGIMARTTRTIKSSHGKICYLNIAAKISEMLLKIPVSFVPAWMEEGGEAAEPIRFQLDAGERSERQRRATRQTADCKLDDRDMRAAQQAPIPPVGDCSAFVRASFGEEDPLEAGFDVMLDEVETIAERREMFQRNFDSRARLFSPVQPGLSGDEPGDEISDDLGAGAFEEAAARVLETPVQVTDARPSLLPKQTKRPLTRKQRRARQKLLAKAKKRATAG